MTFITISVAILWACFAFIHLLDPSPLLIGVVASQLIFLTIFWAWALWKDKKRQS